MLLMVTEEQERALCTGPTTDNQRRIRSGILKLCTFQAHTISEMAAALGDPLNKALRT
jgi:hypothetical protein